MHFSVATTCVDCRTTAYQPEMGAAERNVNPLPSIMLAATEHLILDNICSCAKMHVDRLQGCAGIVEGLASGLATKPFHHPPYGRVAIWIM